MEHTHGLQTPAAQGPVAAAVPAEYVLATGTGRHASPGPGTWCPGDLTAMLAHLPLDGDTPVGVSITRPDGPPEAAAIRQVSCLPTEPEGTVVWLHAPVLTGAAAVHTDRGGAHLQLAGLLDELTALPQAPATPLGIALERPGRAPEAAVLQRPSMDPPDAGRASGAVWLHALALSGSTAAIDPDQ